MEWKIRSRSNTALTLCTDNQYHVPTGPLGFRVKTFKTLRGADAAAERYFGEVFIVIAPVTIEFSKHWARFGVNPTDPPMEFLFQDTDTPERTWTLIGWEGKNDEGKAYIVGSVLGNPIDHGYGFFRNLPNRIVSSPKPTTGYTVIVKGE